MSKVERNILSTYSGYIIDPLDPQPDTICLTDIIKGLSSVRRFSGQSPRDFSVLRHSLLVYEIVSMISGSVNELLAAALHDATEAFYSDVPSPIKRICKSYKTVESRLQVAIFKKYGLPTTIPKTVHTADDMALSIERDWEPYLYDLSPFRSLNLAEAHLKSHFKNVVLHLLELKAFNERKPRWLKPPSTF